MEEQAAPVTHVAHKLKILSKLNRIFIAAIVLSVIAGLTTGYVLAQSGNKGNLATGGVLNEKPKTAQQDTQTFRDFAQGKITKKPEPKNPSEYTEGTHLLIRDQGVPVALTSSVVDLSLYEGKTVKVYGETQKAIKEGWLMDVGKVEETK